MNSSLVVVICVLVALLVIWKVAKAIIKWAIIIAIAGLVLYFWLHGAA